MEKDEDDAEEDGPRDVPREDQSRSVCGTKLYERKPYFSPIARHSLSDLSPPVHVSSLKFAAAAQTP